MTYLQPNQTTSNTPLDYKNNNLITVCHITSVHPRYDIRIFVKECSSLADAGYNINLIVADGLGDEEKHNILIHDVGVVHGRLNRILLTPNKIYQKVLSLNPSIVHFHDPELMFIGLKLAKRGFKVIYDIHENLPKQVLSKYWIKKPFRPMIAYLVDHLERFVVRRISGVVTVIDSIAERFYAYNINVVIVHNYPYLTELKDHIQSQQPQQSTHSDNNSMVVDWNSRKNQLVYIGGISKIRGIEPLIKSLVLSDLSLDLAGPFSGAGLQDEIQKLDGYHKVHYHGVLSHPDAFKLLTHAKIGLLTLLPVPSYIESLPIKLFEYMAAGIPIVASDFKAWESIILKYNCGIMVNPNDANTIATACLYLINHPDIAKTMGENGKKAVLEYFNWESERTKLDQLYHKLSTK
jgi:glycosyltransferase involved in cell wall biosynthesis